MNINNKRNFKKVINYMVNIKKVNNYCIYHNTKFKINSVKSIKVYCSQIKMKPNTIIYAPKMILNNYI